MSRRRTALGCVVAIAALGMVAQPGIAQERGVLPPVARQLNESFADPGANWAELLERDGREIAENRYAIVDQLRLVPGLAVADVGAGSGLLSRIIAQRVGPEGTVYSVDIAETLVEHIRETAREQGLTNIQPILGDARDPHLEPNSVDRVLVVDTYHHFEYPQDMLGHIRSALRPDGFFLLVEPERIEGVSPPMVLNMVRAGKGTFTDEVIDAGFELVEEIDLGMQGQYVLKFRHRGD